MICDYGCNKEAIYLFKNGKCCCSRSHNSCPNMKKINSNNMKGKNKGKKFSNESRNKMRKSKLGLQVGEKNPFWKGGYNTRNIPTFDQYSLQLEPIDKTKRNKDDSNILEVKCRYCGHWFIPKLHSVIDRIRSINNASYGDHGLYCSKKCKYECPIYKQTIHSKNYKQSTSREVQPELRQMRFKIDNYTCQKCDKHKDELDVGLHCHHIEGIRWEPLESADIDKVITLCKNCHNKVHRKDGCKYHELQCK